MYMLCLLIEKKLRSNIKLRKSNTPRFSIARLNKQKLQKYVPSFVTRRMHDKNCLVSYKVDIYNQLYSSTSAFATVIISIPWLRLFIQFRTKFIPSFRFLFLFLSLSLYFSLFLSVSYFLGGDCGERWRNKDTGPGYALSDEQRRNAFIHRRRWWWMRGAHQREPIRSCSRTTNEERREIEGTEGWESGINVARASSTNHSPSDLETLGALSPLFNYLAVSEKRTLLPVVRTLPLRARSLAILTRSAPREEKEEAVLKEQTRDQCYRGYTAKGSRAKGSLINKMTIVSIIHFSFYAFYFSRSFLYSQCETRAEMERSLHSL